MSKSNIEYKIEFLSYWLCSSGLGSGADADTIAIKNKDGLPYVPGKTIKGLLRENIETFFNFNVDDIKSIFGISGDENNNDGYLLNESFFTNATIDQQEAGKIIDDGLVKDMYKPISQIKMVNGVTEKGSLRVVEAVVPCALYGKILNVHTDKVDDIIKGLKLIKRLGANRNRGYGLCVVSEVKRENVAIKSNGSDIENKQYCFKCTLKTDLILSNNIGTEGVRSTLDYIPGSVFMGLAARRYTDFQDPISIFHNGLVQFSDAHVAIDNVRSVKAPLTLCTTKYNSNQAIPYSSTSSEQLKPIKRGYFTFDESTAKKAVIDKSLSIGVEYDRENRCSNKNGSIFTYESISCGKKLLFQINISDEITTKDKELLLNTIVGQQRIGTSHSAQYGLVDIEQINSYQEVVNGVNSNIDKCFVYADSRLIFNDDFGYPSCSISAKELGFSDDYFIEWSESQTRTFQYAPWNGKRVARDSDRWGFEKGSVFVVKHNRGDKFNIDTPKSHVGIFHQEGFGRIILNPFFLTDIKSDGYNIKSETIEVKGGRCTTKEDTPLVRALKNIKYNIVINNFIREDVAEFIHANSDLYKLVNKSQWGNIREVVSKCSKKDDFDNVIDAMANASAESRKQWSDKAVETLKEKVKKSSDPKHFLIHLAGKISKI